MRDSTLTVVGVPPASIWGASPTDFRAHAREHHYVTICAPVEVRTEPIALLSSRDERSGRSWIRPLGLALALASAVVLAMQLRHAHLGETLSTVRPGFVVLAFAWTALSMVAAAYNLLGFTPARLRLGQTLLVQVATSGLRIIAPSAVSTPAVTIRYLVRSGVRTPDALATVGAAQTAQLLVTTLLVASLGIASGDTAGGGHLNITSLLVGGFVLALVLTVLAAIGRYHERVRSIAAQAGRSIATLGRHLRRRPAMVGVGVLASGVLTVTHILAFAACVSAVGGHVSLLALATIYLAAAAAGSIVPTPGGLGAVEAALIAGLTTAGLTLPAATGAALLSRLVAVWLPSIPGWIAVIALRRRALL
jgi:uncharacterized membrane protein YbhN (UPF0104 family)